MPGIASAATAVVIGSRRGRHVDHSSRCGRHHAAESFAADGGRTVWHAGVAVPGAASIWGWGVRLGRIRSPRVRSRRTLNSDPDAFPQDVLELMAYFGAATGRSRVQAVPGQGLNVPLWILGSSLFGAQVAAALGLPFAFASHFAPGR